MTGPWRCASSNCVQVRRVGDVVQVRDSKLGEQSHVTEYSLGDFADLLRLAPEQALGWLSDHFRARGLTFTVGELIDFGVGAANGVFAGVFELPPTEWLSAPSTVADPDTETHPGVQLRSVELSAVSGLVVSDDHPAVQAVLAVTPMNPTAVGPAVIVGFYADDSGNAYPKLGDPAPLAAKQTAAVLRWLANTWKDGWHNSYDLARLADEIAGSVATQPTTEGDQNEQRPRMRTLLRRLRRPDARGLRRHL